VDDSVSFQREMWAQDSAAALAAVEAAGVEIIRPDKALFRERVAAMQAGYQGTPVGDLIARIAQVGR